MESLVCKALFARLRLDASSTLGRLASIARRRPAVTRCVEYLRSSPAFVFEIMNLRRRAYQRRLRYSKTVLYVVTAWANEETVPRFNVVPLMETC